MMVEVKIKIYTADKMRYTYWKENVDESIDLNEYTMAKIKEIEDKLIKRPFIELEPENGLVRSSEVIRVYSEWAPVSETNLFELLPSIGRPAKEGEYSEETIGYEPPIDEWIDY